MQEIIVEKKEKIGFIILNRPEVRNTFNLPFAKQLNDGLKELDADDEIRVIIIKANGYRWANSHTDSAFKRFADQSDKAFGSRI